MTGEANFLITSLNTRETTSRHKIYTECYSILDSLFMQLCVTYFYLKANVCSLIRLFLLFFIHWSFYQSCYWPGKVLWIKVGNHGETSWWRMNIYWYGPDSYSCLLRWKECRHFFGLAVALLDGDSCYAVCQQPTRTSWQIHIRTVVLGCFLRVQLHELWLVNLAMNGKAWWRQCL